MQLFQQPFDASTVKPQDSFEPIPDGWYNLAIRNSEAKPTKDNESGYLNLEIEVIDGEFKGRKLFDLLNLWNKNPQAVEIAQRQLSAYCHATGVIVVQHSEQLHGIPFKGKVSTKHDQGYEPKNVIKTVKHIQDVVQGAAPSVPTIPQPQQPTAPFGQNPALPPQPPIVPPQQPSMPTVGPPQAVQGAWAQSSPAPLASGAPTAPLPWQPQQPAPQSQPGFVPSPQPQIPQPQNGPVPPWRK